MGNNTEENLFEILALIKMSLENIFNCLMIIEDNRSVIFVWNFKCLPSYKNA